jgi:hypothetical protein
MWQRCVDEDKVELKVGMCRVYRVLTSENHHCDIEDI